MDEKEFDLILLKSRVLKVFAIRHRTSAKLFKDLKTDSRIRVSFEIKDYVGTNACYLDIENLDTKETIRKSVLEAYKLLKCFMFNEVEEPKNE